MEGGFRNPITTVLPDGVVDSDAIADGAITSIKIASNLQSDNWNGTTVAAMDATQGWRLERNTGDFGAQDVVLRGTIFATSGELGDLDVVGDLTMQSGGVIQTAPDTDRHLLLRTDASPNGSIIQWIVPSSIGTYNPAGIYSVDAGGGIEQVVWVGPELASSPGFMGIAINENGPIVLFGDNTPANNRIEAQAQVRVIDGSSSTHSITRLNSPNNEGIYFNTQGLVVEIAGALVGEFYDNGLRVASPASPNDAAFPSYTFDVDPNTGMFRAGADTLGFSAGGSEIVRITTTALVIGLGTGFPRIENSSGGEYTWQSDTDTFMYRVSSNVIGWQTGGSLNMQLGTNLNIVTPATTAGGTVLAVNASTLEAVRRQTSALKYKSRVTTNVGYLADIDLVPTKHYRKDDKRWVYGFVADWLAEQDPLLGVYENGEVENFYDRAVMAILAAKVNRLERLANVA